MRIQILPLPSVVVGDDVQEPFALIVDQYDADVDEQMAEGWRTFKENCGARALLITPDTVEVVDRYAESASAEPTPESKTAIPALLEPGTIVLRDRNGNPMNLAVTCSCGHPMSADWSSRGSVPQYERTDVICNGCGNRLTVTVPFVDQA